MTTFTIRFRGVGVFVANSTPGTVSEVLFPRADKAPPNGTDDGVESDPDKKRKMKHADNSIANEHFAGALLIRKHGQPQRFDLTECVVQRSKDTGGGTGQGATIDDAFLREVPPLDDIINPSKSLWLLANHSDKDRVATRFIIEGDSIHGEEFSEQSWIFDDDNGSREGQDYRLEPVWTIDADALEFNVTHLSSGKTKTITLDDTATELYFYNFDDRTPSKPDLKKKHPATPGTVDDDFKWVYKLFEHDGATWQDWLGTSTFPAPRLLDFGLLTVSVSTCFEVVWTGADQS